MSILSLIPVKDWVYGGVIAALLAGFGWYTYHERSLGAVHEVAAVQAASAKAQAAAAKQIDDLNLKWHDTVTHIQVKHEADLKAAALDSSILASGLRNYEAGHSCPNGVLAGAGAPAAGTAPGAGSPGAVEASLERLIAAAEHDNAVITAERAERDSLTGK